MAGYRYLDHTADVGLEAWGETAEACLEAATEGLAAFLYAPEGVEPREARRLRVEGVDRLGAALAWLEEILYLVEGERFLPARWKVERVGEREVEGQVWGEPFDPSRHRRREELKAVTYHQARFERDEEGRWTLRAIFDI